MNTKDNPQATCEKFFPTSRRPPPPARPRSRPRDRGGRGGRQDGVVDDDVEPAPALDDRRHQRRRCCGVADVARHGEDVDAARLPLGAGPSKRVGVAGGDGDGGAAAAELTRQLQAETARVWCFLLPLLMIPAASELSRWPRGMQLAVFIAIWLLLCLVGQNMTFMY